MTEENVPPLSKVPGYRPPVATVETPVPPSLPRPGIPTMDLLDRSSLSTAWTGPRTVLASAFVAALVAFLVVFVLR